MDEQLKKAFDFAQETTKQLISLSTGIIAFTITFAKDILTNVPINAKPFLIIAWVVLFFSIIFGVWTLLALTGTLGPTINKLDAINKENTPISIRDRNITIPSLLQIITFVIGICMTVVFAILAYSSSPSC